jgi:uncharacterized phage protein (TIGR02218 family)
MNNILSALKAHYAQAETTLAKCWKVTLNSGIVMGFTTASADFTYLGVLYSASSGQVPSDIQTSSAMNVDNLEVTGTLVGPSITDADLNSGTWDFALVEFFELNYADLTMGHRIIRSGSLGQVTTDRNSFVAELRGLMQYMQQTVGRVYGDTCDATLGDTRCKLNLTPFTFTGTISSVSDNRTFTATMSNVTEYFNFGSLVFTSGLNIGKSIEVRTFVSPNSFAAQLQPPFSIAVGDTFSVTAGCDKSIVTCTTKFNNSINFRGFPTVPGLDRMVSGT